jgi:sensor histidine kinase regulating citrate/malate metabolism
MKSPAIKTLLFVAAAVATSSSFAMETNSTLTRAQVRDAYITAVKNGTLMSNDLGKMPVFSRSTPSILTREEVRDQYVTAVKNGTLVSNDLGKMPVFSRSAPSTLTRDDVIAQTDAAFRNAPPIKPSDIRF